MIQNSHFHSKLISLKLDTNQAKYTSTYYKPKFIKKTFNQKSINHIKAPHKQLKH